MTRSRSWALLTGRADLVGGRFIALGTHAHTERNPDRQNFTKLIWAPKLFNLSYQSNSRKRHQKYKAGRGRVHTLIALT